MRDDVAIKIHNVKYSLFPRQSYLILHVPQCLPARKYVMDVLINHLSFEHDCLLQWQYNFVMYRYPIYVDLATYAKEYLAN